MADKRQDAITLAKSILEEVKKNPIEIDGLSKSAPKADREVSFDMKHPRYGLVKMTASVPSDRDQLTKAKTRITSMVDKLGKSRNVDEIDLEFRQLAKGEAVSTADTLIKSDANPDAKADEHLGEKVEHDVIDHLKANKGAEAKEGHDLRSLVMEKWEPKFGKCEIKKAGDDGKIAPKKSNSQMTDKDLKQHYSNMHPTMLNESHKIISTALGKKPKQPMKKAVQTGVHNSINPNQRAALGISQAGAEVRDPFRSHYSKVLARNAHKEVLGQMKQTPAPKLPKKELEKWEPRYYKKYEGNALPPEQKYDDNSIKKTGMIGGANAITSPSPGGASSVSVPGGTASTGLRMSEECKKFLKEEGDWQPRYHKKPGC